MNQSPRESPDVVVAICTYRRPRQLGNLLEALGGDLSSSGVRVVVIDNDPGQTARQVCLGVEHLTYIVEPRRGISYARNAALGQRLPSEALAFIDDDEVPDPDWLLRLREALRSSGADAVGGPVRSVYAADVPRWARWLRFHQRKERPEGETPLLATGNVLISPRAFDRLVDPSFSLSFNRTGGEDSEFFWRITKAGGVLYWCPDASVAEIVPRSRCAVRWMVTRGIQVGTTGGRIASRSHPRVLVAGLGVKYVLEGIVFLVASLGVNSAFLRRGIRRLGEGLGWVAGSSGRHTDHY